MFSLDPACPFLTPSEWLYLTKPVMDIWGKTNTWFASDVIKFESFSEMDCRSFAIHIFTFTHIYVYPDFKWKSKHLRRHYFSHHYPKHFPCIGSVWLVEVGYLILFPCPLFVICWFSLVYVSFTVTIVKYSSWIGCLHWQNHQSFCQSYVKWNQSLWSVLVFIYCNALIWFCSI